MPVRAVSQRLISVIVPVYNEEDNVEPLARRVLEVVSPTGAELELIFVDDASTDRTVERIEALSRRHPAIRLIRLSRNFGHQIALTAGLDFCRGVLAISMDGDLQHPPELLPSLIAHWEQGYDVVSTERKDSQDITFFKSFTSRLFYWMLNRISNVKIARAASDFRLLDRECIDALKQMRERDRFLRGLVSWIGYQQITVPYQAEIRFSGTSKYTWRKMFGFAFAGISSFSGLPLRLSLYLGLFIAACAFLYAGFVTVDYTFRLTGADYAWGWTTIVCLVALLAGIQLIMLGIIGEYLFKLYQESKNRPIYLVKQGSAATIPAADTDPLPLSEIAPFNPQPGPQSPQKT